MARVKIEEIVDHIDSEIKKALSIAVSKVIPNTDFDEQKLFREFLRAVGKKCNTWERVPDSFVETD